MGTMTESTVEPAALAWLSELGWQVKHGAGIARGRLFAEREDFGQLVLEHALRNAPLSKLTRGEIQAKDAERFVQDLGGGKS